MTYHRLKQIACSNENKKEASTTKYFHVKNKDAKQIYWQQIQDTPSNKFEICEELHFAKTIKFLTHDLEKEYLSLTSNDRSFSSKKICVSCKRALQNGKLPKFATPK